MSFSYNEFEDSYEVISTSVPRIPGDEVERASVNSIILDKGEKSCKDIRPQEWIHLVASLINNGGYLAFVGVLMYKYTKDSDHYVFSTLMIIQFVFSTYFLFHGIKMQQPFQILMQMLTSLSLWSLDLIYYLSDISNPPENSDTAQIGLELMLFYLRSILCLLNLMTSAALITTYWTIEQAIFKTVGTNLTRISVFRNLFFGFSLMIFDMETSIVTLMLWFRNGFHSIVLHEAIVLSAGSVFLCVWVILGYKAMRLESRALTWTFILVSCTQPVYIIVLFIRNIKWSGSSQPVLTASSHYMSIITLTVHLSVIAAVVIAQHYYGRGYGDALVNGVHVSVKNSREYEELRRILFHPINPHNAFENNINNPHSSRTILLNAEVY